MRLQVSHVVLAICSFFLLANAWSKEDHEIFRLRDELEAAEGQGVTFYDFLGVQPGASGKEIQDSFRKKSKAIHPDKIRHQYVASRSASKAKKPGEKKKPGVNVAKGPTQREIDTVVKKATERYQRLGVVAKLLRSSQRERYDHFLRYGFPKWRGTGYYYNRYRPGLSSVLVGLFLVIGGAAHYGALRISYNRQREFMEKYIRQARKTAWGDESGIQGIPGVSGPVDTPPPPSADEADPMASLNRRQKRELEKQNKKEKSKPSTAVKGSSGRVLGTGENVPVTAPTGARRRVTAENGKVLIVDSIGNVFLEEEDEDGNTQEFILNVDDIHEPTIRDTAVYRLPIWLYEKARSRFPAAKPKSTIRDSSPPTPVEEEPATEHQEEISAMTSSQMLVDSFEIVDSTGIEKDAAAGNNNAKKRGKKSKK